MSSEPDQFALEKEFSNLHMVVDKFRSELISIHKPRRKRARFNYISQTNVTRFKQKIQQLKAQWTTALVQIFRLLSDSRILSKTADNVIESLHHTRSNYMVEDEYCKMVFGCLITPIIAGIMDEEEVSKASRECQLRRKRFLQELIRAASSIATAPSPSEQNEQGNGEFVDVCSSQSQSEQNNRNAQEQSNIIHCCSWEEITIVDYLINALSVHSKSVTQENVEFASRTYHIINISHIVDILKYYLKDLKSKIDLDCNKSRITVALEKFEESITSSLELFDSGNPLYVFRNNLRFLLTQIRMLRSTLNQQ